MRHKTGHHLVSALPRYSQRNLFNFYMEKKEEKICHLLTTSRPTARAIIKTQETTLKAKLRNNMLRTFEIGRTCSGIIKELFFTTFFSIVEYSDG